MEDLKLAILIDADNISPKYVKVILDEAATFGVAACKRIYGDWSDVRLKSWKDALLNNSIIPIQQYSYTTGKNATDSAMIIVYPNVSARTMYTSRKMPPPYLAVSIGKRHMAPTPMDIPSVDRI